MFCPKCGARNPDGAVFCASCGTKLPDMVKPAPQPAPIPQPAPQPMPAPQPIPQAAPQPWQIPQPQPYNTYLNTPAPAQKKSHTGLIVGLSVAAVVVVIAIAAAILLIARPWESSASGGGKNSKTVEGGDVAVSMAEAVMKMDTEAFVDLYPDEYFEFLSEQSSLTVSEIKAVMAGQMDFRFSLFLPDYDPDEAKFKSTVTGEKVYSRSELSEIRDSYYDDYGMTIDDAKLVLVDLTVTYDGEKGTFKDMTVPLVKVGRKWCVDFTNLENFDMSLENADAELE